jgi:hypothetical protein
MYLGQKFFSSWLREYLPTYQNLHLSRAFVAYRTVHQRYDVFGESWEDSSSPPNRQNSRMGLISDEKNASSPRLRSRGIFANLIFLLQVAIWERRLEFSIGLEEKIPSGTVLRVRVRHSYHLLRQYISRALLFPAKHRKNSYCKLDLQLSHQSCVGPSLRPSV